MSKLTLIGLVFLLAGFIVLGYQGMLAFKGSDNMGSDLIWTDISIGDFLSEGVYDWTRSISTLTIKMAVIFLVNMPLFLYLFGVAVICFFIQAFR